MDYFPSSYHAQSRIGKHDSSKQIKDGRNSRFITGAKIALDHDSSAQTVATLDDSRFSHAEHWRNDGRGNHLSQDLHQELNHEQQMISGPSMLEREQEIIRLQRKACKLQSKIGKLQKKVVQLQEQ